MTEPYLCHIYTPYLSLVFLTVVPCAQNSSANLREYVSGMMTFIISLNGSEYMCKYVCLASREVFQYGKNPQKRLN